MYWCCRCTAYNYIEMNFVAVVVVVVRQNYRHTEREHIHIDSVEWVWCIKRKRQTEYAYSMWNVLHMLWQMAKNWIDPTDTRQTPTNKLRTNTRTQHTTKPNQIEKNNTQHLLLSTHFRSMPSVHSLVSLPNLVRIDATTTCRKSFLATDSFVKQTHLDKREQEQKQAWGGRESEWMWTNRKIEWKKYIKKKAAAAASKLHTMPLSNGPNQADIVWGQAHTTHFTCKHDNRSEFACKQHLSDNNLSRLFNKRKAF